MRAPVIHTLCPSLSLAKTLLLKWVEKEKLPQGNAEATALLWVLVLQQNLLWKKTERGNGKFLNSVEERASLFFSGLISREAHNSIFYMCTQTHTHTHLCPQGEMISHKDLKNRHSDFLPGFKGPKQYKNLRINQMTAEENLKMLEIKDTQGNVNTLIFKPTLCIVYRTQCAVLRCFLWQRKIFFKLKLRLPGRTKIKHCLCHIAWCVWASHQADNPERGLFCSLTLLQAAVLSLWLGKTLWSMRQPPSDQERQHQLAGLQSAGAGKVKWIEKSCCMGRNSFNSLVLVPLLGQDKVWDKLLKLHPILPEV